MPVAPAPSRTILSLAVAALVVTAGCGAIGATSPTDEGPPTNTETVAVGDFPGPPENLTAEGAAETAAYHHLAVLFKRLEVEQSSAATTTVSLDSVTTDAVERTHGGYYVSVSLSTAALELDVPDLERAVYLVRENATPRPAFPLHTRGPGDGTEAGSATGADLRATNYAADARNVSVIVTALDGSPSTELVTTLTAPSREGIVVEDAVESPGRFRVSVTMANATASRTVTLSDDAADTTIGVFVGPDGTPEIYEGPG